jgi:hypothetical protein
VHNKVSQEKTTQQAVNLTHFHRGTPECLLIITGIPEIPAQVAREWCSKAERSTGNEAAVNDAAVVTGKPGAARATLCLKSIVLPQTCHVCRSNMVRGAWCYVLTQNACMYPRQTFGIGITVA